MKVQGVKPAENQPYKTTSVSLNRFADRSDECKCQYKREDKHVKPGEMWVGEYGERKRCPPLGGSQGLDWLSSVTKAQFKRFISAQRPPSISHHSLLSSPDVPSFYL